MFMTGALCTVCGAHVYLDFVAAGGILQCFHKHTLIFIDLFLKCLYWTWPGISHPVFYSNIVYKLRRVKCKAKFVSLGSKVIKRLRRWKYDPMIIEKTKGTVLGLSTALYRFRSENIVLRLTRSPVRTPGLKSRIRSPYPQRFVNGDKLGRCVGITV